MARVRSPGHPPFEEMRPLLERYQIEYPFIFVRRPLSSRTRTSRDSSKPLRWCGGRTRVGHPTYKGPAVDHHWREISKHPRGAAGSRCRARMEQAVRFLGFLPFDTLKVCLRRGERVRVPFPVRRFRAAAARSDGNRDARGNHQCQFPSRSSWYRGDGRQPRECVRYGARNPGGTARRAAPEHAHRTRLRAPDAASVGEALRNRYSASTGTSRVRVELPGHPGSHQIKA